MEIPAENQKAEGDTEMMALSFQKRLLLAVILLLVATTVILSLVSTYFASEFLMTRFNDRMQFLAKYLASNAELGLLIRDDKMLGSLASNLLKEPDVLAVQIKDVSGANIIKQEKERYNEDGNIESVSAPIYLTRSEEELVFLGRDRGSEPLGSVELVYSTSGINSLMKRLQLIFLGTALVIAFLGTAIFTIFSRSLAAPLKSLAKASRTVATHGDIDMELEIDGGSLPETRELAEAFTHMLKALAAHQAKLEDAYHEMMEQKSLAEIGHFAFSVAHEIKNPLGIIQGALDILKKPEADEKIKATMIGYVEDEIRRLNRIIQDFLAFSRPQKLRFEDVELNQLVRDLVNKMVLEWNEKGVHVVDETEGRAAYARADSDLLTQALLNIAKNACEATTPPGKVTIQTRLKDGWWQVCIMDEGPGINGEDRKKVFEPFFTKKSTGTGLGLAFAQKIVSAHGGQIFIEANQPKGTMVVVEIPTSMPDEENKEV